MALRGLTLITIVLSIAAAESFLGTVAEIAPDRGQVTLKMDDGKAREVKLDAATILQRVAPGEKDLHNATALDVSAIRQGDRALVTLTSDGAAARRIVVMSAEDISQRNQEDRREWNRRGVAGVVMAKSGEQITLRSRSFTGPIEAVVTIDDKTSFRRYAPDSVRFADARPSTATEIQIGDQLRARGAKSEDGTKVHAEEVVFGTFVTKSGTITAIDPAKGEITIADLTTRKPLTVKLQTDSQIKKMPDLGGTMRGPMQDGSRRMSRSGAATAGRGAGPRDLAQMLERLPTAKLGELKPGETIVVSSTKGSHDNQITAIMLVTNAEILIRMATAQSPSARRGEAAGPALGDPQMGMGSMGSAPGGLDLGGIMP